MLLLQALIVSCVCGLSAWFLHHRLQRGPVLASAVVTLAAGLIMPKLFAHGAALVPLAACASYVSMSATIRLRNIGETSLALALAAVLYTASTEIFVGVGGKLGTIAAISVMTVWGCCQAVQMLGKDNILLRISTKTENYPL